MAGLSLIAFSAIVHAQTGIVPAQISEEGLRRQEERARELSQQLKPKTDLLRQQDSRQVSGQLPLETPCFPIRGIHLVGPYAGRFSWLQETAQTFLNQCAGANGLSQIAAALDAKLVELGYVTSRVSLPEQNLRDGVLRVHLHIGRVAQIRMVRAGTANTDDGWGTWKNAFPISEDEILNIRHLEQGVEQMKRLPSQAVATELAPGEAPDTSDVRILRQSTSLAERIRGGVTIDNSGSRALGGTQVSGYASLDNPLGLSDLLSISANSNLESPSADHRSQSLSFNYSIPWGYNTFTFSHGRNRFAQIVQGTTARFLSSGSSENTDLRWHRIMWRTSATKLGIYAGLGTRRANSFLDDVELIVQRRRTTTFETGVTFKHLAGDVTLDFELGYRRGMPWQSAQDDLPTAAAGGLTARPTIATLSGAISVPFKLAGMSILHSTNLRTQYTTDLTLSVDQFAIGSPFTVRGFDGDAVLLAESGYAVRNEWSTPIKAIAGPDSVAFIGLDFGRVWGPSAAMLVGDRLAGTAFGVRGKWQSFQFDLALGAPLYRPEGFPSRRWNPYLSVTWTF